jgi:hypothetical protein
LTRRLALLALLAAAALALAAFAFSHAAYTTTSQTDVTASADAVGSWLSLYSQGTDPQGLTGYAVARQQTGVAPPCATGQNAGLSLAMGTMRTNNTSYTFNRAFTFVTPAPYPDGSITQATVTASLVADAATGLQPILDVRFAAVGSTGGSTGVTVSTGQKRQANVRMRLNSASTPLGTVLRPHVIITVTYAGSASAYYVYDVPLQVVTGSW